MFEHDLSVVKNPLITERRLGKIFIAGPLLSSVPLKALSNMYAKLIPTSVTYDYARQLFELTAFSQHFESIEEGEDIPLYHVKIKSVLNKKKQYSYYVTFTKVEDNPLAGLFK